MLLCCIPATSCQGPTAVSRINSTIGDINLTLSDLHSDQVYHVWVASVSATSSQSTAVHLTLRTRRRGLSHGTIVLLLIAVVLLVLLAMAAFVWLVRYIQHHISASLILLGRSFRR